MTDSGGADGTGFLEYVPAASSGRRGKLQQQMNIGLDRFVKQGAAASGRYERGSAFGALSLKKGATRRVQASSSSAVAAASKRCGESKKAAIGDGEGETAAKTATNEQKIGGLMGDARGDGENVEPVSHGAQKQKQLHVRAVLQTPTKASNATASRIKPTAGAWGGAAMAKMLEMKTPKAAAADTTNVMSTTKGGTQSPPCAKRPVYRRNPHSNASGANPSQSHYKKPRNNRSGAKLNPRSKAEFIPPWSDDEDSDEESEGKANGHLVSSQSNATRSFAMLPTRPKRHKPNPKPVRILDSSEEDSEDEALDESTCPSRKSTPDQKGDRKATAPGAKPKKVTFATSPPIIHFAEQDKRSSESASNFSDDEEKPGTHRPLPSPGHVKLDSNPHLQSNSTRLGWTAKASIRPPTPLKGAALSAIKDDDHDQDDSTQDFRTPSARQNYMSEDGRPLGKENLEASTGGKKQAVASTAAPPPQNRKKGIASKPQPKRKYSQIAEPESPEDEGIVLQQPIRLPYSAKEKAPLASSSTASAQNATLESERTNAAAATASPETKKNTGPVRKKGVAQKVVRKKAGKAVY